MELVCDRLNQRVCVCTDCQVPVSALEVLKLKREKKWGNQE
jgi:hypothetical protein